MTITDEESDPMVEHSPRAWRLVKTQRALQIILGLFWLLDAGLQFQPFMFGKGFATTYLLNSAQGQPAVISWIISNVGHFVEPHVAVWNAFFALIQVAIGGGLLFRRTVRPALVVSFFWAFGVWFYGEGLGFIFTGSASALTGAPGSVFIYGLLGLMAWPHAIKGDEGGGTEERVGIASSAAGQGPGGATTPLLVWCGYWSLAAVLFLLPDNRTATSISSRDYRNVIGRAERVRTLSQQLRDQIWPGQYRDDVALGDGVADRRIWTIGGAPTITLLVFWWPHGRILLDHRPRLGRDLHRVGHRSEHRTAHCPFGLRHGAGCPA